MQMRPRWHALTPIRVSHCYSSSYRYLAELLIGLVRATSADLALRPLSEEDEHAAHEELLPPMLHNNHAASGGTSCLLQVLRAGRALGCECRPRALRALNRLAREWARALGLAEAVCSGLCGLSVWGGMGKGGRVSTPV